MHQLSRWICPFSVPFIVLALSLITTGPAGLAADSPVEGRFRELTGTVRFANANPEILNRLQAPGHEGMSSLSVRATALPPSEGIAAQVAPPVPDRVANPYQLSVQAGTNAATAIAYEVQASIGLKDGQQSTF